MEKNKKYKVVVSARARKMLGLHLKFLAKVSKSAADTKRKSIIKRLYTLDHLPERYPYFEGDDVIPARTYRKMYLEDWYEALYEIVDGTVYVAYIMDCRRECPWLLDKNWQ